ncbi:MAG: class I SAM-dependent methyltransferase [Deltaproteobacteria bacterium]|nr:class I SAM-dependent methyltransferase [Deltaproteobacteria bacterium]MBI4794571.1 class I SAM-dependent methyltransferase [Deltaproteobacteria bacterium]
MPDWGEIFAAPEMQRLRPNPEFLAALPVIKVAGCRRVLDAGCGAGRHLLPLAREGFVVWGVDREAPILEVLQGKLRALEIPAQLALADLERLPFAAASFHLVVSINVINHGDTRTFEGYCRELDRVLEPGGHLFVYVSPREFAELVRLPQTRELEPGTLVDIATPDGNMIHHFPTPEEIKGQFPGYRILRGETILAPIPFMRGVEMPQYVFWAQKP